MSACICRLGVPSRVHSKITCLLEGLFFGCGMALFTLASVVLQASCALSTTCFCTFCQLHVTWSQQCPALQACTPSCCAYQLVIMPRWLVRFVVSHSTAVLFVAHSTAVLLHMMLSADRRHGEDGSDCGQHILRPVLGLCVINGCPACHTIDCVFYQPCQPSLMRLRAVISDCTR